jgi:hypothetical protein
VVILCTYGFAWRARILRSVPDVLDSHRLGYDAAEARAFFEALVTEGWTSLYWVSQLTLDMLFPVGYSLVLAMLFLKLRGDGIVSRLWGLPLLAGLSDVCENFGLVWMAWTFDGQPSSFVPLISAFTILKWVLVFSCGGAVLVSLRRWPEEKWPILGAVWLAGAVVLITTTEFGDWAWFLVLCVFAHKRLHALQYLFFLRFPILIGAGFVILPRLAWSDGTAPLFRNLFVLEAPGQRFVAALTAGVMAMSLMWLTRLIFLTAPARCELPILRADQADWYRRKSLLEKWAEKVERPWREVKIATLAGYNYTFFKLKTPWLVWAYPVFFSVLAVPFVLEVWLRSARLGEVALLGGLAVGPVLAIVLRVVWPRYRDAVEDLVLNAGKKAEAIIPKAFRFRLPEGFGGQGHRPMLAFLGFALLGYVILGWTFHPSRIGGFPDWMPAACYLFVVVMVLAWLLSTLSLFLDKWRVPVLILMVGALFLVFQWTKSDHFYEAQVVRGGLDDLPSAGHVIPIRHDSAGRPGYVSVVAASGGGIKAALWTNRVLQALDSVVGPDFGRSVTLFSTVSGGSAGSMYVTDAYSPGGPPSRQDLQEAVQMAGASTLSATMWGLAYPDLRRILSGGFFPRGGNQNLDRGWAMDQRWEWRRARISGESPDSGPRLLGDWVRGVTEGWRPAHIFNSTVVETGAAFRLSTVDLAPETLEDAPGSQPHEFSDLYRGIDLNVATAARLSATFPWVSPISRIWIHPDNVPAVVQDSTPYRDTGLHLADGGYFDNFGIYSAIGFLDDAGPELFRDEGIRRVLFIEIRASGENPGRSTGGGLHYSLAGPVLTMTHVLSSSQIAHNDLEVEQLRDLWAKDSVAVCNVVFSLEPSGPLPLSWHLTEEEQATIINAWGDSPSSELDSVRAFFSWTDPGPESGEAPLCGWEELDPGA